MTRLRTSGRAVVVVTAALLGALVAAWLVRDGTPPREVAGTAQARAAEPTASPARPPRAVRTESPPAAAEEPTPPTGLRVPALDLELPVRALGVDDRGGMALPETPFAAAWYRFGPGPLDPRGATVVAGHVDTAEEGIGPLAGLTALRPGESIVLDVGEETVRYRVEEVRQVDKAVVDLEALFSRDGPSRLHLVTCGGPYLPEAGGYQANVVVVASRA